MFRRLFKLSRVVFEKSWRALLGDVLDDVNYWVKKGLIPVGTLKPFFMYDGEIPLREIVTIPLESLDLDFTSRTASNILILGGSGDMKSAFSKLLWFFISSAGCFCVYVDPKSTDSGRARKAWANSRMPPFTEAKGIKLKHYMPVWATYNYEHLVHNFVVYSDRLKNFDEREKWMGIGMSNISASKTTKFIREMGVSANVKALKNKLFNLKDNIKDSDFPSGSFDNAMRVLTDIEDFKVVDEDYKEVDLYNDWKNGYSVCLSYNNASKILMTFDIGQKIRQSGKFYFTKNNRIPIFWFFDDSSFYAKHMPEIIKHNFAVQEIKEIGFNLRSLGVYNVLAVQSLAIIDEAVAETYRIKIISPLFQGVDSLSSINIPHQAIEMLKSGQLVTDRKKHLLQFLLIDGENQVTPFFPFFPPVNHYDEVYYPKGDTNA